MADNPSGDSVRVPIDGTLDLHTFKPSEAEDLIIEYLSECQSRNILDVRIIHGKGTGQLREKVHAALRRLDSVESFRLAGDGSGWGATVVRLKQSDQEAG
ncbi:MAG: hypothetical protein OHK006_25540 [Thermodesulfovibrionales bacterium]